MDGTSETKWHCIMYWSEASPCKKCIGATTVCIVGRQIGKEVAVHGRSQRPAGFGLLKKCPQHLVAVEQTHISW
jgi:hypothetical protein